MSNKVVNVGKYSINVVYSNKTTISPEDELMDKRITAAVNSAIKRAEVCDKPIAKYDKRTKKVYLMYANGEKKVIS